jgi:hypothetical protein
MMVSINGRRDELMLLPQAGPFFHSRYANMPMNTIGKKNKRQTGTFPKVGNIILFFAYFWDCLSCILVFQQTSNTI